MSSIAMFDAYLGDNGPAALVLREELTAVEGRDGVLFPPTFAPSEDGKTFPGGYNIDGAPGDNVCLIDTVGAQANRIEPLFGRAPYAELVPQITVRAGERAVSLLEAGHRAGDALVRCSGLQDELQAAFRSLLRGDANPLAKVAPTSLVFGVWDSRGTQAKAPRLVASTIRAFNVVKLTRSAQFNPAVNYEQEGLLVEPEKNKKAYSERGFIHVPASGAPGGVVARGGIRREATLSLAALRLLRSGTDEDATLRLRRYVLGLGLVAFTADSAGYLRQGCNLVLDADAPTPRQVTEVYPNGERRPFAFSHSAVVEFARVVAVEFGVGASREVVFDQERVARELAESDKKKERDQERKARGKTKKS